MQFMEQTGSRKNDQIWGQNANFVQKYQILLKNEILQNT